MYSYVHSPNPVVVFVHGSLILRTRKDSFGDPSRASLPYWKKITNKTMAWLFALALGASGGAKASLLLACN